MPAAFMLVLDFFFFGLSLHCVGHIVKCSSVLGVAGRWLGADGIKYFVLIGSWHLKNLCIMLLVYMLRDCGAVKRRIHS